MMELFPQPVTPNKATLYTRLRMMSVEGHHFDEVPYSGFGSVAMVVSCEASAPDEVPSDRVGSNKLHVSCR